jgi:predicted nicotinamide N-methyase
VYKEEILNLKIKDKNIDLIQISNIDEIFDELIKKHPENESAVDDSIPYWTDLWPAALGMSEFILENESLFQQKRVIEIGCGLGLPSIVAANVAKEVTMSDYLNDAIVFAKRNAALNKLNNINFELLDWRSIEVGHQKYDVILASDIAYEKRFFDQLPFALKSMMHYNSMAVLSEPGRAFAKDFVDGLIEHFAVTPFKKEVTWKGTKFSIGIYVLRAK